MMMNDNDVFLSGELEVDKSIYCNGEILFEDLSDIVQTKDMEHYNLSTLSLYDDDGGMKIFGDLFIDGNIIFDKTLYSYDSVFEKIKFTNKKITPKTITIKCGNFMMANKFRSSDNYIHTDNNGIILQLRKMKIKKLKKND